MPCGKVRGILVAVAASRHECQSVGTLDVLAIDGVVKARLKGRLDDLFEKRISKVIPNPCRNKL